MLTPESSREFGDMYSASCNVTSADSRAAGARLVAWSAVPAPCRPSMPSSSVSSWLTTRSVTPVESWPLCGAMESNSSKNSTHGAAADARLKHGHHESGYCDWTERPWAVKSLQGAASGQCLNWYLFWPASQPGCAGPCRCFTGTMSGGVFAKVHKGMGTCRVRKVGMRHQHAAASG